MRTTDTRRAKAQRKRHPAPYKTSQGLAALSPDGLYRLPQFLPSVIGIGKTRWYAGLKRGEFPAPAVQRKRMTLWRGADILAAAAKFGQPLDSA